MFEKLLLLFFTFFLEITFTFILCSFLNKLFIMSDDFEIPKELIDSIIQGNCIAFVGAGFSKSCNLPDWPTLLEKIVDNVDNDIKTASTSMAELNEDDVKENGSKSDFFKDTLQRAMDSGDKSLYEAIHKLFENNAYQGNTIENYGILKISDTKKLQFLRETIQKARDTSNADLYDLVAQLLEDTLGVKYVEKLVEKALAIPAEIPHVMRNRLKILNDIPFKAILTTNFDLFLNGSTPWTADTNDQILYPYSSILRNHAQNKSNAMANTQIEDFLSTLEEVVNKAVGDDSQAQDQQKYFVRSKRSKPLIKLHGSTGLTGLERSLVWTRTGYRKLLHQTPGYANFLRSVLATSTVLYLGFSFSDGYLNDLRGEVMSMLYGNREADMSGIDNNNIDDSNLLCNEGNSSELSGIDDCGHADNKNRRLPIAYALVNDKSVYEIDFFRKLEGVQILSYDTKEDPNTKEKDFSGFDRRLKKIHELTSFAYHIGEITYGKRILVYEMQGNDREKLIRQQIAMKQKITYQIGDLQTIFTKIFQDYKDAFKANKPEAHEENPFTICGSIDETIEKLKATVDPTSFRYDVLIVFFGEDWSSKGSAHGNHQWKVLVDKMRELPFRAHTPFIVFASTGFNEKFRRKFCLSHGAYDFATSMSALINNLAMILEPKDKISPQEDYDFI